MLLHNINTDEIKKNNTITKLLWYKCLLMRYIIKFWESGWQGVLLVVFMTRRVVFVKMRCVYISYWNFMTTFFLCAKRFFGVNGPLVKSFSTICLASENYF